MLPYNFIASIEYLAQKNMSRLIHQKQENVCLFAYTETDGLGIIDSLLKMFRFCREIKFMDKNQAIDINTSFSKGNTEKTLQQKALIFSEATANQGQRHFDETILSTTESIMCQLLSTQLMKVSQLYHSEILYQKYLQTVSRPLQSQAFHSSYQSCG